MNHYTITLFCKRNQWHFEATVTASSVAEAWALAVKDYSDKWTRKIGGF